MSEIEKLGRDVYVLIIFNIIYFFTMYFIIIYID